MKIPQQQMGLGPGERGDQIIPNLRILLLSLLPSHLRHCGFQAGTKPAADAITIFIATGSNPECYERGLPRQSNDAALAGNLADGQTFNGSLIALGNRLSVCVSTP